MLCQLLIPHKIQWVTKNNGVWTVAERSIIEVILSLSNDSNLGCFRKLLFRRRKARRLRATSGECFERTGVEFVTLQ